MLYKKVFLVITPLMLFGLGTEETSISKGLT